MGPVLERIRGAMVAAALRHNLCWVVFEPNSDPGHQEIRDAWHGQPWPRVPSMRAEHFARLLRKAHLVCGNSSAVVREAPAVGTPAVSLGDRQQGRSDAKMLISLGVPRTERQLLDAIAKALTKERVPCDDFGDGHSSERFRRIVTAPEFWERRTEKQWMYVV